ncbi:CENPB DNA-binding domain containing protein 1-like 7 [Homarus americanus]|uniref:CENPB DNA-binding domain containing protein 1-like 7 n=1 Tax=Homarus americanus TaxID=6706 RepID=A0A8J5K053_HOMAM|nr:CENPB DNA-binding domain containing protein 1-like 7 [Homarus americanus]
MSPNDVALLLTTCMSPNDVALLLTTCMSPNDVALLLTTCMSSNDVALLLTTCMSPNDVALLLTTCMSSNDVAPLITTSTKTPSNVAKRSRVAITLDVKLDIVKRHEHGEGTSVIGRVHGLAPSTVHSIVKSANKIKEMAGSATPLTGTKVKRFHDAEMESMERMLSTWIDDQTQRLKTPLSQRMIQQKAVENNSFQCKLTAIRWLTTLAVVMRVRWLTTLAVKE